MLVNPFHPETALGDVVGFLGNPPSCARASHSYSLLSVRTRNREMTLPGYSRPGQNARKLTGDVKQEIPPVY